MADLKGSLCISKLENVTCSAKAKEADLKSKHHLHELTLRWSEENVLNLQNEVNEEEVIECLHPNKNIKVIRIHQLSEVQTPSTILETSAS